MSDIEKRRIEEFKDGWLVGNFHPAMITTPQFEICYRKHLRGETPKAHYHKIGNEYTLIIRGHVRINDREFKTGDIITIPSYTVSEPLFLEDTEIMVFRGYSNTEDKYECISK